MPESRPPTVPEPGFPYPILTAQTSASVPRDRHNREKIGADVRPCDAAFANGLPERVNIDTGYQGGGVPYASLEEPLWMDLSKRITPPNRARMLTVSRCWKPQAVELTRLWHSRLPNTQDGPWVVAYSAACDGVIYAVALWNTPSARTLPHDWLELRRMACSPLAPFNTPSYMLARMAKDIKATMTGITKLISYQDTAVHEGTIYKASNWTAEWETKPRVRDRTGARVGTGRLYRKDINTTDVAAAGKVRWALALRKAKEHHG